MIKLIKVPVVSEAVKKAGDMVKKNHEAGRKTLVFCDDALYLDAERTACEACGGGMFEPFVYTFSSFLGEYGADGRDVLSTQGSAMVMNRIMRDCINIKKLSCFKTAEVAGDVYDAVSMLYSSHVDVKDLAEKDITDVLLKKKLSDICLLYEKYFGYLEANNLLDANTRYTGLPDALLKSGRVDADTDVVFVGYRSLSYVESEVLSLCMGAGGNVFGIFPGGRNEGSEDDFRPVYTDAAVKTFAACAEDLSLDVSVETEDAAAMPSPETAKIVSRLYNGRAFAEDAVTSENVHVFEAVNAEEELEYIGARIRQTTEAKGARYRDVSVMMPNVESYRPLISRVFSDYDIPYYIDGRLPLADTPVCSLITDLLSCVIENCPPDMVDAVVSNPLFDFDDGTAATEERDAGEVTIGAADDAETPRFRASFRRQKDEFRNYVLLFPDIESAMTKDDHQRDVCKKEGFWYDNILAVWDRFSSLVEIFRGAGEKETTGEKFLDAVSDVLDAVGAKDRLSVLAANSGRRDPAESRLYATAYEECVSVVGEVCGILGNEKIELFDLLKTLRNAFSAKKVSVSGRKTDEVRICDISKSIGSGTDYLFAAGMTNDVPYMEADTSLLTSHERREIARVGRLDFDETDEELSKILRTDRADSTPRPVSFTDGNAGYRETAGLNVASFGKELWLSYPVRVEGKEDVVPSEIISYVRRMFCDGNGKAHEIMTMVKASCDREFLSFLCGRKNMAFRYMMNGDDEVRDTIEDFFAERKIATDEILKDRVVEDISCGKELFTKGNDSPIAVTTLEEWFACPYKAFLDRGLGLQSRKTSQNNSLKFGTFVHKILEEVFPGDAEYGPGEEQLIKDKVSEKFDSLLNDPKYETIRAQDNFSYVKKMYLEEIKAICLGAYRQLVNSGFTVEKNEYVRTMELFDGVRITGKIDRVDKGKSEGDKDKVRVIDYKTYSMKANADTRRDYYMGKKLQPELYLCAVSVGKIPAGAYYFPAKAGYSKDDNNFSLVGFTSSDFVDMSDEIFAEAKAECVSTPIHPEEIASTYLSGVFKSYNADSKKSSQQEISASYFDDFLRYSLFVVKKGAEEMTGGFIRPTPANGSCKFCDYSGICGYSAKKDYPERKSPSVASTTIAMTASDELATSDVEPDKLFKLIEYDYAYRQELEDSDYNLDYDSDDVDGEDDE